ncbi:MAG TPA: hypothetical protein PLF85_17380 [Turneriella sp.]|nr:hypothetical protein [Turneriella sp.]
MGRLRRRVLVLPHTLDEHGHVSAYNGEIGDQYGNDAKFQAAFVARTHHDRPADQIPDQNSDEADFITGKPQNRVIDQRADDTGAYSEHNTFQKLTDTRWLLKMLAQVVGTRGAGALHIYREIRTRKRIMTDTTFGGGFSAFELGFLEL